VTACWSVDVIGKRRGYPPAPDGVVPIEVGHHLISLETMTGRAALPGWALPE
jgi:hypothetical protein